MDRKMVFVSSCIIILVLFVLMDDLCYASSAPFMGFNTEQQHVLLTLTQEDDSYGMLFNILGVPFMTVAADGDLTAKVDYCQLLIVPESVAKKLTDAQIETIVACIQAGGHILTEGQTPLSKALGIQWTGQTIRSRGGYDTGYEARKITWPRLENLKEISPRAGAQVLFRNEEDKKPIAIKQGVDMGAVLFYSRPIISNTGDLYQYFPYVHEHMEGVLKRTLRLRKDSLVTYFDWGYYYNQSPKAIARDFRSKGINQVHYSGWYDTPDYWQFTKQFIHHAHSNGIRVYLWLELPMVTEQFWINHPEWRQKTASGQEAKIDWRYLMALEDPACMAAVKSYYERILNDYDWDGVDLAELYFESPGYGLDVVELFTPMSDAFRTTYEKTYGIDPIDILNPSSQYYYGKSSFRKNQLLKARKNLLTQLNKAFLNYFDTEIEKDLDVVLTMIDVEVDQQMSDNIGIDSDQFIDLLHQYHFTLNIEDPFTLWALGPERYSIISNNYRQIIGKEEALTVDINIVNRLDTEVPHPKQTGVEFLNLLWESSQKFDQVAIYASHTPYDNDFSHATYALVQPISFDTLETGMNIQTQDSLFLEVPTEGKRVFVNGNPWPFYNDQGLYLTRGQQFIEIIDSAVEPRVQVVDIRGEIVAGLEKTNATFFRYNQKQTLYIGTQTPHIRVILDGNAYDSQWFFNGDTYYVQLPKGDHTVELMPKESQPYEIILEGRLAKELTPLISLKNNSQMISAGKAAERLGGTNIYDSGYKTTTIGLGYYSLWARSGDSYGKANGVNIQFSQVPYHADGDIWIPLVDFFTALGYQVEEVPNKLLID